MTLFTKIRLRARTVFVLRKDFAVKEELRKLFTDVWNVPNVLTMLRLALIPVFVALHAAGYTYWALTVFCIASLTDALDGIIARKYNLVTSFGKLMDPLADKLMVCTALICQGRAGVFPWAAIIIVAVKECIMIFGGAYMLKHGIVVYANYPGKAATVSFIAALILSFFHDAFLTWGYQLDRLVLWLSVVLTLLALLDYTLGAWKQLHGEKKA